MKQHKKKPFTPTRRDAKAVVRAVLQEQRRPPARDTQFPAWFEWPWPAQRAVARLMADLAEQFGRRPGRTIDPLLCFHADFHIPPRVASRLNNLEKRILILTGLRRPVAQIASLLGLKSNTIHTYKTRIGRKLDTLVDRTTARELIGLPPWGPTRRRR